VLSYLGVRVRRGCVTVHAVEATLLGVWPDALDCLEPDSGDRPILAVLRPSVSDPKQKYMTDGYQKGGLCRSA